jgi:hypothetical protein
MNSICPVESNQCCFSSTLKDGHFVQVLSFTIRKEFEQKFCRKDLIAAVPFLRAPYISPSFNMEKSPPAPCIERIILIKELLLFGFPSRL